MKSTQPIKSTAVVFQYLIARENKNEQPAFIAITTTNDSITAYGNISTTSEELQHHLFCFSRYIKDHPDTMGVDSRKEHAEIHKPMHLLETEKKSLHYHIKHEKQLKINTLRQYLKNLAECPEPGTKKTLLTHKVRKDILQKYKEHYVKNLGKIKSSSTVASNANFYNNPSPDKTLPTIVEHAYCLNLTSDSLGCLRMPSGIQLIKG